MHSQWRKRLIIATGTLPRVYDDTLSIYLPRLFVDVSLSLSFSSRLKVYIFRYNFYFVKWRIIVETSQLTSQLLLEIINREIALATCLVNSSENNFAEQPNTKVSWFGSYLCFSILFVNTVLTVYCCNSDTRLVSRLQYVFNVHFRFHRGSAAFSQFAFDVEKIARGDGDTYL